MFSVWVNVSIRYLNIRNSVDICEFWGNGHRNGGIFLMGVNEFIVVVICFFTMKPHLGTPFAGLLCFFWHENGVSQAHRTMILIYRTA